MEELRSSGRPVWAFVLAHAAHVFVYWTIYSACQSAWSYWFYPKSIPAGLHSALFGVFMVVEYYSMVFVRSKLTVRHFPRVVAAYFSLYQAYFYATLYGFYFPSLVLFLMLCVHAMIWFFLKIEVPSFQGEEITEERPRAYIVRLGEPRWSGSSPPMMTLLHPVTENLVDTPRSFAEMQEQDSGESGGQDVVGEDDQDDEIGRSGISALLQMAGVSFNPSTYGYQRVASGRQESTLRQRRKEMSARANVSAGKANQHCPTGMRKISTYMYK